MERLNISVMKRLQIAHAEKKRTEKESWTPTSPSWAALRFNVRTKLPELSDVHVEQGLCDRESEQKSKGKNYADTNRWTRYSEYFQLLML